MPNSPPRLLLASSGTAALLRLTGKPSLDVSNHLRGVTERLLASGHQQFTVDLKDCPSVDSTFIGVLLFVTKAARRAAPETGRVCLLNAGEQVRRQIDTLGVLDRFDLAEADASGVRFEALPVSAASKAENTRVCLEAHRALIEACAANAAKFHDVIQFLEADLRGPASTAPPPP